MAGCFSELEAETNRRAYTGLVTPPGQTSRVPVLKRRSVVLRRSAVSGGRGSVSVSKGQRSGMIRQDQYE